MTETFSTTIKPTISSQRKHKPRVKEISYGNGYKQIFGDGINSNKEIWSLTFTLNDSDKQTVEDFFATAGGYIPFNWTAPENGATQKQYLCTEWAISPLGANKYQITCTFEEWAGLV